MYFLFDDDSREREALITAVKYDDIPSMYKLTLLGIDDDGNFTIPGLALFNDEEFKDLISKKELKSDNEVVGRRIKITANIKESEGKSNEEKI